MRTLHSFVITDTDAVSAFSALHDRPYSLFFDSADQNHPDSRHSIIAWDPLETVETSDNEDCFALIKEHLQSFTTEKATGKLPPFTGGAAGCFGYDLARTIEHLPVQTKENSDMPDMMIGIYDRALVFDHETSIMTLYVWANTDTYANKIRQELLALIESHKPEMSAQTYIPDWQSDYTPEAYENAVQKVIDYIYAGDIFQANLSQRFSATIPASFDPFTHYCHLRSVNPAPFAAYMNFGDTVIASASPERFLSVTNGHVETKPIKGTRPRGTTPKEDKKLAGELLQSEKDRAENVMIVDLLRNDISKACADDSVDVTKLCELESFAGVHHLVSTITGTLRPDEHALDLLRGCFPGGSITGAPKIRAMEIIEELETYRRGPYCGALGYIGFNGNMDTNIVIRTLVYHNGEVSFNVGGGIVADSGPAAEYEETLDKAAKIFRSFTTGNEGVKAA